MIEALRSRGLPTKGKGNGGQGGDNRRGDDGGNRRPASVKVRGGGRLVTQRGRGGLAAQLWAGGRDAALACVGGGVCCPAPAWQRVPLFDSCLRCASACAGVAVRGVRAARPQPGERARGWRTARGGACSRWALGVEAPGQQLPLACGARSRGAPCCTGSASACVQPGVCSAAAHACPPLRPPGAGTCQPAAAHLRPRLNRSDAALMPAGTRDDRQGGERHGGASRTPPRGGYGGERRERSRSPARRDRSRSPARRCGVACVLWYKVALLQGACQLVCVWDVWVGGGAGSVWGRAALWWPEAHCCAAPCRDDRDRRAGDERDRRGGYGGGGGYDRRGGGGQEDWDGRRGYDDRSARGGGGGGGGRHADRGGYADRDRYADRRRDGYDDRGRYERGGRDRSPERRQGADGRGSSEVFRDSASARGGGGDELRSRYGDASGTELFDSKAAPRRGRGEEVYRIGGGR